MFDVGSQHPLVHAVPLAQQVSPSLPHDGVVVTLIAHCCRACESLAAAPWQLSSTAVVVAVWSTMPALVHFRFEARQLMIGWYAGHCWSSAWHSETSELSFGHVSCEHDALPPFELEQATLPANRAATAATSVRSERREARDEHRRTPWTLDGPGSGYLHRARPCRISTRW